MFNCTMLVYFLHIMSLLICLLVMSVWFPLQRVEWPVNWASGHRIQQTPVLCWQMPWYAFGWGNKTGNFRIFLSLLL